MSTSHATTDRTDANDCNELFALVAIIPGLDAPANDAAADDDDVVRPCVGGGCPGGCHGGMVADRHGPSAHNPSGLEPCPVCG